MEKINETIPSIVHESWYEYLQPLFNDNKMKLIKNDILPKIKYYPTAIDIFRVFEMPIDNINVVLIGQDPYFNGSANGYAFSVNMSVNIPVSLSIIEKEIKNSQAKRDNEIGLRWKTLEHWRRQGVFLLNTALTVEIGKPNSHAGNWMWFTREVIKIISTVKQQKPIWLLWGGKAKSFRSYIDKSVKYMPDKDGLVTDLNDEVNYVLEADHPAAETYPGSKGKFTGCNHFNLVNDILTLQKRNCINW